MGSTGGIFAVKDFIFAQVENGQTTTIAKGALCAWDTTDNSAVAGINQNTRGLRIIVNPAPNVLFNQAGFADIAIPGTPAGTRGAMFMVQLYGFRNDLEADAAAADNDTIVGGLIIPSVDTAGKVMGCSNNAAPTGTEVAQAVGIALGIVGQGATGTIEGLVGKLLL